MFTVSEHKKVVNTMAKPPICNLRGDLRGLSHRDASNIASGTTKRKSSRIWSTGMGAAAPAPLREQPAAWIEIRYRDLTAFTLVLCGGDNGLTLLGAHAREGLGLAVDPVRKVLEPSRFPLA